MQDAVHEALEIWSMLPPKTPPEPLNALQGSLADVDIEGVMRGEREAELKKDSRWSEPSLE